MVKEISETELDGLVKSTKIVIVDFSAVWCGPCKNLGKILESKVMPQIESKPEIALVKIDIDKNKNLAQSLQVMSVPTIMIFFNGKRVVFQGEKGEQDRIVGLYPNIDEIIFSLIEELNSAAAKN